jgi:hypothetical protein
MEALAKAPGYIGLTLAAYAVGGGLPASMRLLMPQTLVAGFSMLPRSQTLNPCSASRNTTYYVVMYLSTWGNRNAGRASKPTDPWVLTRTVLLALYE